MFPGEAYEAVFSGELEPITPGGSGEADYTFTVNAEGTSGKPDFRVRPDEQVVCVGKSATFIAEKRLNDQSPWEPKVSNWTFNSTEQPPAASSKTFATDDPGIFTVTAEANGLSGSATLTVVKVDITGFSVPYTYACAPECPTINHQATCYATIEPLGVATITYSPQGDAHGAFIDASTGVITPSTTKSGEITVRATASILPECYAESTFVIRARPTNVSQSTVSRLAVPVGGEWIHTFNGTGGSLSETEVVETITEINWPFRRVELETGGSTTLDENGTMEGADKIWEPGWNFDINDFLPSPPKAGLPQDGTHAQEWDWCCPMCYGARRDIEQGVENITFTLFEDALSPTGYSVKITTGYGATGEPIEFVYAGEPLL
jgi:hypothetical protein